MGAEYDSALQCERARVAELDAARRKAEEDKELFARYIEDLTAKNRSPRIS